MTWEDYKRDKLSAVERQELAEDIAIMAPIVHLAHLRRQRRVTQKQVAERLNTSQASVARMERTYTLRSLHAMAKGMGLQVSIQIKQGSKTVWPIKA